MNLGTGQKSWRHRSRSGYQHLHRAQPLDHPPHRTRTGLDCI